MFKVQILSPKSNEKIKKKSKVKFELPLSKVERPQSKVQISKYKVQSLMSKIQSSMSIVQNPMFKLPMEKFIPNPVLMLTWL